MTRENIVQDEKRLLKFVIRVVKAFRFNIKHGFIAEQTEKYNVSQIKKYIDEAKGQFFIFQCEMVEHSVRRDAKRNYIRH